MSAGLTPSKLLTIGAVIFAGYALHKATVKPGGVISAQPAQAQRDDALTLFNNLQQAQGSQFGDPSMSSDYTFGVFQ